MNRSTAYVLIALIATGLCAAPQNAEAAIPQEMHYQGRLTDNLGDPLQGSHTLTFRIFDAEVVGMELWSETEIASLDANGVFAAVLGDANPLDLPFDTAYWLEVIVDGETVSPRRAILTSAYAFFADDADQLGGLAASNYVVEGEVNAVTEPMVAPDIVSSVDGVSNDAGDIDLVAGTNITITPDDGANTITISASGDVGITGVYADGGLGGGATSGDAHLWVNTGTGLEISTDAVAMTLPYSTGSAYDSRFVNDGQSNSITTGMVVPDIVSSIEGVSNDGGNIDLVEGSNITITPGSGSITIASTGGTGDITAVYANDGLSGTATSGDANLSVNTGAGLQISSDAVAMTSSYSTGLAYDSRFVNEGQPNSITSAMIGSGQVGQSDVSDGYIALSGSQTASGIKIFTSQIKFTYTSNPPVYITTANSNGINVNNDAQSAPTIWAENEYGGSSYLNGVYAHMANTSNYGVGSNARSYFGGDAAPFTSLEHSRGRIMMTSPMVPEMEVHVSGTARLENGRAHIKLDTELSEVLAVAETPRVFVTPTGLCNGLAVVERSSGGFTVQELASGTSNVSFDWLLIGRKALSPSSRSAESMPSVIPEAVKSSVEPQAADAEY